MSRLICLAGTPSPKLHAVLDMVRAIVQVTLGEHIVVVANSLDSLRGQFPDKAARNEKTVILFSDYPQPDILPIFRELNAPLALCVDDFSTIALFSVVSRGFGGVDAARFAAMGLVNLESAVASPPPASLVVGDPRLETVGGLIRKLATLYRLSTRDGAEAKVLDYAGFGGQGAATLAEYMDRKVAPSEKIAQDGRAALERRSPLEPELIAFLAPQYDPVARGRPLEKLEWPVYSLLRPEFPDRMTIGPIDLTGPARYVYYGPYFALPAGAWRARVSFEVRECLSDNQIAWDVSNGQILAVVHAKLPPEGVYGCQIEFEIEDPSKPVEIRMQLLTGAIEGVIQLRRIELRRLGALDERGRNVRNVAA